MVGPQLWVASPQFTGRKDLNCRVVKTATEARAAVSEVTDAGYDFIKLTVDITPEVFDAIVAAARQRRVPIVGHVDPRVGVRRALKAASARNMPIVTVAEALRRAGAGAVSTAIPRRRVFRKRYGAPCTVRDRVSKSSRKPSFS